MLFRLFLIAFLPLPLLGKDPGFDHRHLLWDQVVAAHVQGSRFDYAALSGDTDSLDAYLEQLDFVSRAEVDAWPRDQQLAFWINAYNAFTVRAILDHYPIKTRTLKGLFVPRNSIIQIPGVWKKLEWEVAGQSLTLDHMEHGIIRPDFREPRIHFAIVCASVGCPDLRPEAYTFDKLDNQLEDQTRHYLSNPAKGVMFDYEDGNIRVSQLFKWFPEDFVIDAPPPPGFRLGSRPEKERIILRFVSQYLIEPMQRSLLMDPEADLDFLHYDWSLNDVSPSDEPSS